MTTTITVSELISRKERNYLIFTRFNVDLYFDLADKTFKRVSKTGRMKEVASSSVRKFFAHLSGYDVPFSFKKDPIYRDLVSRVIYQRKNKRLTNFVPMFSQLADALQIESYLLLDIKIETGIPFERPVSQFSKNVIRFMRESGLTFGAWWEKNYEMHPKLITDLCTHVMENYHDNILVYTHLYNIIKNRMDKLVHLVQSTNVKVQEESKSYTHLANAYKELGYGAEYKALFDYVVRCVAVEAMCEQDVIDEYYDYLRMARKIKQLKQLEKLKDQGDLTKTIETIGLVDYRKIEKYPKGLTIRHRIVTRNYNVMRRDFDESVFSLQVQHDYAWAKKEYCVTTAKSTSDIKNEGTELNHCVGSYIDSVMTGKTQIAFLRKADNPEQSLVTLEIRSRGIQQARGYGNRDISDEERAWLELYAQAKNLTFGSIHSDETKPCPTPNPKAVTDTTMVDVHTTDVTPELVEVA
jgi:hypothetical protein